MEKNWRVKVYQDPFTRTKLEGIATVVAPGERTADGCFNAKVRFDGNGEPIVVRQVWADDVTARI